MSRGKGQAVDRLKTVNQRLMRIVQEDGVSWRDEKVKLLLDSTGTPKFVYLLPDYVSNALDMADRVTAATAESALAQFEEALKAYAAWKKDAVAELVILATFAYAGVDEDGRTIGSDSGHFGHEHGHKVALSYELAYRIGSDLYHREAVRHTDERGWSVATLDTAGAQVYKPGSRRGYHSRGGEAKILIWSAELEAELQGIQRVLDQAARVMHRIATADDVAAMLLSLGGRPLLGDAS